MLDELLKVANQLLGPIHFEGNRRAIVPIVATLMIWSTDYERIQRIGRIIGNHTLTQKRIDWALKQRQPRKSPDLSAQTKQTSS